MMDIYPSHLYFLGLGALGYDQLWGRMTRDGVFSLVKTVITSRVFPNGTLLLGSFTGWTRLDAYATPSVIFYDNLLSISHQYPPYRYLLVSLFSTMQTVAHCMLIFGWSSTRSKRKRSLWDDLELGFWGVFNQAWGAAVVYPLYCFSRWGTEYTVEFGPTDLNDALALVIAALLGSLTPVILLYPAFSASCSTQLRQCLIAAYRLTPLSLPLLYRFLAFVTRSVHRSSLSENPKTDLARKITAASLLLSASFSTVGHLYAIFSSMAYSGLGGLFDAFWPGRRGEGAGNMLAHAAHTFLQLDVPIISLALIPFADMLLSPFRGWVQRNAKAWGVHDGYGLAVLRWAALGTVCTILSPGSVVALALGARCAFSVTWSTKG